MAEPKKTGKRSTISGVEYRWKIRYRHGGKGGTWTSGTIWAPDKASAYAEIRRRECAETDTNVSGMRWSDGLRLWELANRDRLSESHIYQVGLNVGLFIRQVGDIEVSQTTPGQINRFVASRAEVSSATANRARRVISVGRWLRRFHDVPFAIEPSAVVAYREEPQRPRSAIDAATIDQYLSVMADHGRTPAGMAPAAGLPIIRFLFLTGVRSSEACRVRDCDVGTDSVAMIQKGGRARVVQIDDAVLSIIREAQARPRTGDHVFSNAKGRPWTHGTLRQWWTRRLQASGLPFRTIHEIRHTFCTLASAAGFSPQHIQAASGHESLTALLRYMHPTDDMARGVNAAVRAAAVPSLYPNRTQIGGAAGKDSSSQPTVADSKRGGICTCPHCGKSFNVNAVEQKPNGANGLQK